MIGQLKIDDARHDQRYGFAEARRRAARVVRERPEASLREIARAAGVSVVTARDVRLRVRNGMDPVPDTIRDSAPGAGEPIRSGDAGATGATGDRGTDDEPPVRIRPAPVILDGLREDPALRYSEHGRQVLRWLDSHQVSPEGCARAAAAVPAHSTYQIAELATAYALVWQDFARILVARARRPGAGAGSAGPDG